MPNPIRKRFGYGKLWALRPTCSQNRAGSYICRIRLPASVSAPFFFFLFSFFLFCENRPRSDLDGLFRVWPNASGLEAIWCAGIIWPGFWQDLGGNQPSTSFRLSGSVPFFHRHSGQYCAKPARIRFSSG